MRRMVMVLVILILQTVVQTAFAQPPTDGMIAYYRFNGNADDESGHGWNGVVNGAVLAPDRCGNPDSAYYFDGSSNIVIPNSENVNLQGGFSFVAWVNFNENIDDQVILCKHNWGHTNGCAISVGDVSGQQDNRFTILVCANRLNSSYTYNDGTWHQVVGTFDGATEALYVDGLFVGSQPADFYLDQNPAISIGATADVQGGFHGYIDDVIIYDRALTPTEIWHIFDACGDADYSCFVDIDDVVYILAFIFAEGAEPQPYQSGDANCSDFVDIDDAVYLIAYIFQAGPFPCENC